MIFLSDKMADFADSLAGLDNAIADDRRIDILNLLNELADAGYTDFGPIINRIYQKYKDVKDPYINNFHLFIVKFVEQTSCTWDPKK